MNEIEKKAKAGKEAAEISKKIDAEKRLNKLRSDILVKDIKNGRDTTKSAIDLKYSSKRLESLEKDRQRALNKMK